MIIPIGRTHMYVPTHTHTGHSHASDADVVKIFLAFTIVGLMLWLGGFIYRKVTTRKEEWQYSSPHDCFVELIGIAFSSAIGLLWLLVGIYVLLNMIF